ncbi:hypothetical protein [Ktedonobacter racemifer]|uniref:Uncharacterized protein n=1 Tax=Ktedonobacter racemifer DSM 44963 TaxID=485913 RepID=D6TX22_KTERA|nr:hypothetical protein [Ktedonobacter racemifer]EFH84755.1 hypothetical protein Krac_5859 [Ktedonobacter racemifer DSM 44963]
MTDYFEVTAMPRQLLIPTREQLFAFCHDLVESNIVMFPCLILQPQEHFDHQSYQSCMYLDSMEYRPRLLKPVSGALDQEGQADLLFYCNDEATLREVIDNIPSGEPTLCFRFDNLNFGNKDIAALYQSGFKNNIEEHQWSGIRVRAKVFVFRESQMVPIDYEGEDEYSDLGSLEEMIEAREDVGEQYDGTWSHRHDRPTCYCVRIGWDGGTGHLSASIRAVLSRHFGADFLEGYSGGTLDQ